MLTPFDWLRRSRTSAELLAALRCLEKDPDLLSGGEEIGAPLSALSGPCERCWIYPRDRDSLFCSTCGTIRKESGALLSLSRRAAVVWTLVRPVPLSLRRIPRQLPDRVLGGHRCDGDHFLLVFERRGIQPWLQELALRHGPELKGIVQILPSVGTGFPFSMGDLLCQAIHYELTQTLRQMRVRFYAAPSQVMRPDRRDENSLPLSGFLELMEMAGLFRALLKPDDQKELFEVLSLQEEQSFYWGRILGRLDPRAREMLVDWQIRTWSPARIRLFSDLLHYVAFPEFD